MKYKEIFIVTRPNTSVPFFPTGSIHAPDSETDWTTAAAYTHYMNNYVTTGKCDLTTPLLSDDGLTLTYTTLFNSEEAISEMYGDVYYLTSNESRNEYWLANGITSESDILPIT